jgi:hypothetical protein
MKAHKYRICCINNAEVTPLAASKQAAYVSTPVQQAGGSSFFKGLL